MHPLAAADATSPTGANWSGGSVKYELMMNGNIVATENYTEMGVCCLALNGAGAPIADTGSVVGGTLTHPGGDSHVDCGGGHCVDVSLRVTANSDSGNEEWWTSGTLRAASVLPVELQSFTVE